MSPISWKCGFCGEGVSVLTTVAGQRKSMTAFAVQCPLCGELSVNSTTGVWYPPASVNRRVKHLPPDVEQAWLEACRAADCGAFTAAEIMCRKILMHIAVDVAKSPVGKSFVSYVEDLESKGYISTGLKPKIDAIRSRGNVANHDLPASPADQAEMTLQVTRHLLVSVYELPAS